MPVFTLEEQITRWEAQRTLKNLMGKYVLSALLEQRDTIWERFWSGREDVCMGFNEGWYKGPESIQAYYAAQSKRTEAESLLMKSLFPDKLDKVPEDQIYGVGHLDNRPVSAPVIVVADDGQTAKGMWTSMGCYNKFDEVYGPQSHWNWSVYAVDFVLENGDWKIWHLQYLTELDSLCGRDWSKPQPESPVRQDFAPLKEVQIPAPDVPVELHAYWTPKRLKANLPKLPVAYSTFAETFSYGI